MPKVSVIMTTARDDFSLVDLPGVHLFQPTVDSLKKQTFRDFEFIVVDHLHSQRLGFFGGLGFPVKHIPPKPSPYLDRGQWSVCNSFNTGLVHAEGELVVRVDDASEFESNYLQRIWNHYSAGHWPLSLVNYFRGGKVARYDEVARDYYRRSSFGPILEGDIDRKIAMMNKMYEEGMAIEDSRLKLMAQMVMAPVPWGWVYGYVAIPLAAFLEVNGYDEAFDGKKSLEDPDLALRLMNASHNKFILDKGLWAIENFHANPSEKALWDRRPAACCNYAILKLHEANMTVRANERKFTPEELRYIREETMAEPCSHNGGVDFGLGDVFDEWARDVPVFDLRELRERIVPT